MINPYYIKNSETPERTYHKKVAKDFPQGTLPYYNHLFPLISIWVVPKIGGSPKSSILIGFFHYFHHLFLGCFPPIFGFPPIYFPLPSLLHFFDFSVEPPVLEDLVLALRFAAEFQVQQMPQVKRFQPKGWPISRENWGRQLEEMGPCFF